MVVEAAAAGQGVALGHRWLAAADLESGRIVMPFGPVLPSKFAYYLVSPEALAERRRVRLFREWLLEEAEGAGAKRVPLSRSEEHTSELQSLMRTSYDVLCLKKEKDTTKSKK